MGCFLHGVLVAANEFSEAGPIVLEVKNCLWQFSVKFSAFC
jgi:hypothetical protein